MQEQTTQFPLDDSRGFHPETIEHLIACMKQDDARAEEFATQAGEKREELAKITAKLTAEAEAFLDQAVAARARGDQWRELIAFARARQQDREQAEAEPSKTSSTPGAEQAMGEDVVVVVNPELTRPDGRPVVREPYRLADTAVMPAVPGIADNAVALYRSLETGAHAAVTEGVR